MSEIRSPHFDKEGKMTATSIDDVVRKHIHANGPVTAENDSAVARKIRHDANLAHSVRQIKRAIGHLVKAKQVKRARPEQQYIGHGSDGDRPVTFASVTNPKAHAATA